MRCRLSNKIFGITVSSASPRSAVWSSRTAALIVPQDPRPPFRDAEGRAPLPYPAVAPRKAVERQ